LNVRRAALLEELSSSISRCRDCPLSSERANAVPGEGDPSAWIMLIGEAPGAKEDREGRPFVGSAGKLLDELLAGAGVERESVYITNILKCRPPGNRDPRKAEISACRPHLEAQIRLLDPRVVCTLGRVALKVLLGKASIRKCRGKPAFMGGRLYLPTLHPAACLYDPRTKDLLLSDFRLLGRLVAGGPEEVERRLARETGLRTIDSFL